MSSISKISRRNESKVNQFLRNQSPRNNCNSNKELKEEIIKKIIPTKRGLAVTRKKALEVESLVKALEEKCPLQETARSPLMNGNWIVDYTTAPPPSNGKLGPFIGVARQIINLDAGTYTNYLSVPGDIEKEWLSAKLEATFEEWDGNILNAVSKNDDLMVESVITDLDDGERNGINWFDSSVKTILSKNNINIFGKDKQEVTNDYGKDSWRVDFKTLTITVFGFPFIKKTFDEGTSRVWKMTYLDQDGTRIVRAGRTGKDEDSMLFYMSREES